MKRQDSKRPPAPAPQPRRAMPETAIPTAPKLSADWKKCPICGEGRGGQGRHNGQYEGKSRHYFKCDTCAHTWSVDLEITVTATNLRLPAGKFPPAGRAAFAKTGPPVSPAGRE